MVITSGLKRLSVPVISVIYLKAWLVVEIHMLGNGIEQPTSPRRVQVVVEVNFESSLVRPGLTLGFIFGVNDDTHEGRATHKFRDQLLRGVQTQFRRIHSIDSLFVEFPSRQLPQG